MALAELANQNIKELLPHTHIILNFGLLFYGRMSSQLPDLFSVFFGRYPGFPDDLTRLFQIPSKIVWSFEKPHIESLLTTDHVSPLLFASRAIAFFNDNPNSPNEKWCKELFQWVCGCGDLEIAARATHLMAAAQFPLDPLMLDPLLHSFSLVCSVPIEPETRQFLEAYLTLFNSVVERFKGRKDYLPVFRTLFEIAEALLSVPTEPELCCLALTIITRLIDLPAFQCPDPSAILYKLAPLTATLPSKDPLYAAILALVHRYSSTRTASIAFIVFLPSLFLAMSAYYNAHPFSDREIQIIFGCGFLLSSADSINQDLSTFVTNTLRDPAQCFPDDFILQCCIMLSSSDSKSVVEAGGYLVRIARGATAEHLSAVLFVSACLLEAPTCTRETIDALAPLAEIAAKETSAEATRVLAFFVQQPNGVLNVPEGQQVVGDGWSLASDTVRTIAKGFRPIKLPKGTVKHLPPIPAIPLTKNAWQCEAVKETREKLSNVVIEGLTKMKEVFAPVRDETRDVLGSGGIHLPENVEAYEAYMQFLKD
jgi:hypothetical protein